MWVPITHITRETAWISRSCPVCASSGRYGTTFLWNHLDRVSLGAISTKDLNYSIYSNSDHMTINALMQTDLCSLGINFMHQPYKHYDIKNLKINGCEPFLLIGIVRPEGDELSKAAQWFIENFKKLL